MKSEVEEIYAIRLIVSVFFLHIPFIPFPLFLFSWK